MGAPELSHLSSCGPAGQTHASRLERLLDIIHLASVGDGWTSRRLARRFNVSRRRIFEDLHFLGRSGFRLFHDGKGYRLAGSNPHLPVTLRVGEILALLRPRGKDCEERETAQRKLAAALPAPLRSLFRDTKRVRTGILATPVPPAIWGVVDLALAENRILQLRYRGLRDGDTRDRVVEPHILFMRGTGWYLGAWCRSARGWRLFRMDRVETAELKGERFEVRDGFDIREYVSSDIGVWVGKALGAEVEVLPSHVEAVRSEALALGLPFRRHRGNGAILVIPRGNLDEAAWWLARFGEGVRVLRPPELRVRLVSLARRIVDLNRG